MIVAILGAGSVALASACWIAKEGHSVRIWSALPDEREALARNPTIAYDGIATGTARIQPAASVEECVSGADMIMLAAPAFAHDDLIAAIVPHVLPSQMVVFHPVTGLSCLILARQLRDRGIQATIVDLSTSLFTARREGTGKVKLFRIKDTIDLATIPSDRADDAIAALASVFGPRFRKEPNVLAVSLNNHNPIYHVGPMLTNLSRVERAEPAIYWDWMSPAVCRLIKLADDERLKVVRHYGTTEVPIESYFHEAHAVAGANLEAIFPAMSAKLGGPLAPSVFDHRFITEDVPYGLVFFWSLGAAAGIDMPVSKSMIDLASSIWDEDFIASGRTVERLGIAALSRDELLSLVERGYA